MNTMPSVVRETIAQLELNVGRAEALTANLTDAELSWKPAADVFSLRENIWHMRDIDFDGYLFRVEQTLTRNHPVLPDLDGLALAQERRYNELPIGPALQELRYARSRARQLLGRITDHDLGRTATFETVGEVTVTDLLRRWLDHDAGHIADLEQLRASLSGQGKPPGPREGLPLSPA